MIQKFNIINYKAKKIDKEYIIKKINDYIDKKIKELANKNINVFEKINEFNEYLHDLFLDKNDDNNEESIKFSDIPSDTRFFANFSSLGDHIIYTSAMMEIVTAILISEMVNSENELKQAFTDSNSNINVPNYDNFLKLFFGTNSIKPDMIKPKELIILASIVGMLHDITKPDITNHAQNSGEKAKDYLGKFGIDSNINESVYNAISNHHTGLKLDDNILNNLLKLSDWISASERSAIFNPEYFQIILNDMNIKDTIFTKEEELNRFKEILKTNDADGLLNFTYSSAKYPESKFPLFYTSEEQVKNSHIYKVLQKINEIIRPILKNNIDLISNKKLTFFSCEFKGIQNFIFQSKELKYIRNASEFIKEIEDCFKDGFTKVLSQNCIITLAGGELLAICPSSLFKIIRESIINEIKNRFNEFYPSVFKNIRVELEPKMVFSIPELYFGLEQTGYNFEDYWNSIAKRTAVDLILSYFNINPKFYEKIDNDNDRKFLLLSRFIQKKGFGELISYYIDLPSVFSLEDIYPNNYLGHIPNLSLCSYCGTNPTIYLDDDGPKCGLCKYVKEISKSNSEIYKFKDDLRKRLKKEFKELKEEIIRIHNSKDSDQLVFSEKYNLRNYKINNIKSLSLEDIFGTESDRELPKYIESLDDFYNEFKYIKKAKNRMALIKMDGNNIGFIKSLLPTLSSYKEFSRFLDYEIGESIKKAMVNCVIKDINELLLPIIFGKKDNIKSDENREIKLDKYIIPFEPVIIGGDDITILCKAQYAFYFCINFFKDIEEKLGEPYYLIFKNGDYKFYKQKAANDGVEEDYSELKLYNFDLNNGKIEGKSPIPTGFSAGIVFGKYKEPLNKLFQLADNLEQKAKEYIKNKLGNLSLKLFEIKENKKFEECKIKYKDYPIPIGSWNSIAAYITSDDLTETSLNNYYSEYTPVPEDPIYYYLRTSFPKDNIHLNKWYEILINLAHNTFNRTLLKESGKGIISYNKIKTLVNNIIERTPNYNKLLMHYYVGKEKESNKIEALERCIQLLLKKYQKSNKTVYKIPLYDYINYMDYYLPENK